MNYNHFMRISAHPALDQALESELRKGPLPFPRFMELALYHPEEGYYCRDTPRIGRGGDFQTGPHQSPWLGKMLARQIESLWERTGRPAPFEIREYGPGEGWLARDILESLEKSPFGGMAGAVRYTLIERSAPAAARIRERLTRWISPRPNGPSVRIAPEAAADPPGGIRGVILANEFLDALPFHILRMTPGGLRERYVERRGGKLAFTDGALSDPRLEEILREAGIELGPGQTAEVSLAAREWIASAASGLKKGAVLILDYGFSAEVLYHYHPSRREGTFRGYRRHTITQDVLAPPGETDITAHVDFTSLLRAARASGLTLAGFTDQCHFLLGLGIAEAMAEEKASGPEAAKLRRAAMGLLDPGGLGGAIKVLLLAKNLGDAEFPAFRMKPDDRESLATL